ncbi:MAG: AAA family ATPase, partial [Planctomycetota bacterium]|nr:AAA family ATPase [Planctomycetota bacterium]
MTTLDGVITETLHSDQARRLRGLVEQRQQHRLAADNSTTTTATVIAVTSGKGGVGKSCLALNLSIALARLDVRVALLDTSLGLGHLDLMCGLNGYWNLGHVLAGTRRLPEITLEGPSGIHVIPGAGRLSEFSDGDKPINPDVSEQLVSLETEHDVLVLDTGHREHPFVVNCLSASDTVLVVTTPEPTALADAYA